MTKLTILPKKDRFTFLNIEDILNSPDQKWIIEGFIPETSLCQLFGPSDIGKSFVVLDMALCVATGTKWLGHDVVQGPVIYVAAEGSRGMKKRIISWLEHHNLHPDCLMENFRMIGEALPLGDPVDVRELIRLIQEKHFPDQGIILIVLDTQARCTADLKEENSEMSKAIAAADRIKNTTGAAVLLIHHTGLTASERARGYSGVFGALDAQASLTGNLQTHRLTLTCYKTKDDEKFKPIPLKLIKVGDSLVSVSRAPMSATQYLKSS